MTETLQVDVSNPGQVFACLGLLEVLDLFAPGSEGAFASEREFQVRSGAPLARALESVAAAKAREEHPHPDPPPWGGDKAWPVVLDGGFGSLVLDPWLEPDHGGTSKGLKLWAGRVDTLELVRGLLKAIPAAGHRPMRGVFEWEASGTPTGLDMRSAVSKEDLGYSYNSQNLKPVLYPVVDTFAMIGLEAARPPRTGALTYRYSLWTQPLPPVIARATLAGKIPSLTASRWVYRVESRGLGGTYRYLSQSNPEEMQP